VAGVLEAARIFGSTGAARTLVLACWDEEERGLLGSTAYAARAAQRGEKVFVMYSFEMLGYRAHAPGSQRLPRGLGALFPAQTASLAANGDRGDFLAILPSTPARPAAERIAFHAAAIGLPVMVLEVSPTLATSALASDLRRSDHAPFWDQGVPAILATDTAEFRYGGYHCTEGPDAVQNLDQAFLTLNVRALIGSVADALSQ
jgi:Zn-dependent M28 family amino/carboxypeptidase